MVVKVEQLFDRVQVVRNYKSYARVLSLFHVLLQFKCVELQILNLPIYHLLNHSLVRLPGQVRNFNDVLFPLLLFLKPL